MGTTKQIQNAPIPHNLVLSFAKNRVQLPVDIRDKIDQHWQGLIAKNPKLRNGEIFTVTSVEEAIDSMVVTLAETDYAHYLYSQQVGDLGDYTVHIIHPAALVVTADNKFIFGSMGEHTSRPGVIQCCGGGIDHSDIKNGVVDVEHAIIKELAEELGIDTHDKNLVKEFYPAYLKSGGPTNKMTISYILRITQTADQFMSGYQKFVKILNNTGDEPEFGELFYIDNSRESIEAFIAQRGERLNEYMAVLFRDAYEDLPR